MWSVGTSNKKFNMIIIRQKCYSKKPKNYYRKARKDIDDFIRDNKNLPQYLIQRIGEDNANGVKNFAHDLKWATHFDPKNKRQMELMSSLYFGNDKKKAKEYYKRSKQNVGRTVGKVTTQVIGAFTGGAIPEDLPTGSIPDLPDVNDMADAANKVNDVASTANKVNDMADVANKVNDVAGKVKQSADVVNGVLGSSGDRINTIQSIFDDPAENKKFETFVRDRLSRVSQLARTMKTAKKAGVSDSGSLVSGKGGHQIGISVPDIIEDVANYRLINKYGRFLKQREKDVNGETYILPELTIDDYNDPNLLKLCKAHEDEVVRRAMRVPSIQKKFKKYQKNPVVKLSNKGVNVTGEVIDLAKPLLNVVSEGSGKLAELTAEPIIYAYKAGKYISDKSENLPLKLYYLLNPDDKYQRDRTYRKTHKTWKELVAEDIKNGTNFASMYEKVDGKWVERKPQIPEKPIYVEPKEPKELKRPRETGMNKKLKSIKLKRKTK